MSFFDFFRFLAPGPYLSVKSIWCDFYSPTKQNFPDYGDIWPFLDFFFIFVRKLMQKGFKMIGLFIAGGPPKRTQNASATQPRLFIDFAWIAGPIFIDF